MSVAKCLGLDEVDGPAMVAAAVAWQRWCHQDPELAVVDELLDLPGWTRRATTAAKDALQARLHRLAQDDAEAATVLAWLLLPGATRLADKLRDLSPDIDALTAGELWLHIRTRPVDRCVAATILRAVRRSLLAELGHAEAARRHDRTWANTTLRDNPEDLDLLAGVPEVHADAIFETSLLVQSALLSGLVSLPDASLLEALATAADERSAPGRRGRAGLTSPAVVEHVARYRPQSVRSIRRRASMLLDRLRRYAEDERLVEELRAFVAAHEVPPMTLDDVLEDYLWQHIEEYVDEIHRELDESA
ncbi:hypothetical protein [Nocardioides sp. SYSU D00038]|uniref:hypothetical protein n=1 Tax=Nocardioides sp. SYSU D00038 TaxID=2812554 RepID=UPI0019670F46|nr:hypothetical protein [Nocardioides sp. SYSU D00038]